MIKRIINRPRLSVKQNGFTLLDVLIALAIIGILSVGFMSALTNSSRAAIQTDQMDTGRTLAQMQMECIRKAEPADDYTPITIPQNQFPNYSAAVYVENVNYDSAIQKITVVISHNGKTVASLEDYKVK
jgi:prepilin-type N-terminal cleavage/methylation domain-containing protein